MTLVRSVAITLTVATGMAVALAQQPSQTETPHAGCPALPGFVPDNVQSIAGALAICGEVQRVLDSRSQAAKGALAEQQFAPGGEQQAPAAPNAEAQRNEMQMLEARQRISEAIAQATLDSNLVSLQLREAMIERQVSSFNAEQRAYRRTKILNAFLGTTVGAVGSGLQFSNNVSVQHVGDGISVAGGAITAVFALCTADIDLKDSAPDNTMVQAFRSDNADHAVPDDVWSYMQTKGALPALAESFASATTAKSPWLSCHLSGAPAEKEKEKKILNREKAIGTVNSTLLQMNRDLKDLSNMVLREVEPNQGRK
jgi:hypothetical protein